MNKKNYKIFFIILLFLIIISLLGIVLFFLGSKQDDKIVSALPDSTSFLETVIKPEVEKENLTFKTELISQAYHQTQKLVDEDVAIAKLDSHLPYTIITAANENKDTRWIVIAPFYFPKFGMYNWQTDNEIKTIDDLKQKEEIKILIPKEEIQQSLALRFLEQIQLITRIQGQEDDKKQHLEKFKLSQKDYKISSNIKLSEALLPAMFGEFQQGRENKPPKYDVFLNYPGVISNNNLEKLKTITTLKLPTDLKDPLIAYSISLIAKAKNKNHMTLEKIKLLLQKEEILKTYYDKFSQYIEPLPLDKTTEIVNNINDFFKTA